MIESFEEQDYREIEKVAEEIIGKSANMTFENFLENLGNKKKKLFQQFIGEKTKKELLERKKPERFYFYSENEVAFALYMLYSKIYNARHIAKICYKMEEGERFWEEFDAEMPLGMIMLPNGAMAPTSIVKMEMQITYPIRNDFHGMPFEITSIRLSY